MQLDRKIAGLLRKIEETSRRRNFFLAFSQSPVDFINALIASQVGCPPASNAAPSISSDHTPLPA